SRFLPYLLSLWNSSRKTLTGVDLAAAAFLLLIGLLLAVLPTVVFIVPALILAIRARPHWVSYAGPLGMGVAYVGSVLLGPPPNACIVDDGRCDTALRALSTRFSAGHGHSYTLGPVSFVHVLFKYFVHLEADLHLLSSVLCMLDLLLCVLWLFRRRYCWRCFAPCIRTAPAEIPLRAVPLTRVSSTTLLDICDNFSRPPVDIIKMATGYKGCYCGQLPCMT
nr:TF protein [Zambian malbrouck virus 1]